MPAFKAGDHVQAIGNVPNRGRRGIVRDLLQGKNEWYLVRFQGGTDEVYEKDNLQIAAERPEDSAPDE